MTEEATQYPTNDSANNDSAAQSNSVPQPDDHPIDYAKILAAKEIARDQHRDAALRLTHEIKALKRAQEVVQGTVG